MKNIFLVSFLTSVVFLLVLNITFGTYFEGYEAILNPMIGGEFCSQIGFSFFVPGWFCVFPVFSFLAHYFNSLFAYSWETTLLNVYILTFFTGCIILLVQSKSLQFRYAFLLYALFFLAIAENLFYVYNLRISIFSLATACLFSYVIQKFSLKKRNYAWVCSLVVIAVFSRLEIALITSLIVLTFSILFDKTTLKFSLSVLLISVAAFIFFKIYNHHVYPQYEIMLTAEHEFDDKQSISPDDLTDKRTVLIMQAMSNFIQDDDVYTVTDYENLLNSKSFTDYVRLERFPKIYVQKLVDLWNDLQTYLSLFFLTLVLASYSTYLYIKEREKRLLYIVKIVAFIGFNVVLVLALNIDIICPHNFIVSVFSLVSIVCTVYLLNNFHRARSTSLFLLLFFLAQLFVSGQHFCRLYTSEQERNEKGKTLRLMLEDLQSRHKQIVFGTGSHYDNYPSRLFSPLLKHKVNHYYADFFLSRYPFFMKHGEEFFGKGYCRMKSKISTIANNEDVVYMSNENFNGFITEYLQFFHGWDLKFTPVEISPEVKCLPDWKPYYMHVNKNK